MFNLTVIIINWNAGSQLRECVDSLLNEGVQRIIVVDNASADRSTESIENLPYVKLIYCKKNLGFAKACNLGASYATSEYLLFLNPDAMVFSDSIDKVVVFMQDPINEKVGICGVQLVGEDGEIARSCARFPSVIGFLSHAIGLDRVFPRLGHFMAEWPHDCTQEVDHVIGAFFFVRRALFDALGGFDERFFVYLEDLDFSYRAKQAGWRSVYLTDVQAFHAGGGTSNQVKAKRLFYSLRSRLLYAFKHFSLLGAVVVLLATLLMEPFSRSALALARRSWSSFHETWSGYGMLWRWLPQWIIKGYTL